MPRGAAVVQRAPGSRHRRGRPSSSRWKPLRETVGRIVVRPEAVLETLVWREKTIAQRLLNLAIDIERDHRAERGEESRARRAVGGAGPYRKLDRALPSSRAGAWRHEMADRRYVGRRCGNCHPGPCPAR